MKKRRKLKVGRIIIFILLVIIFIILLLLNLGLFDSYVNKYKLSKLNYSDSVVEFINDNKLVDKVIKYNDYSKTLEMAISNNSYKDEYFNDYLNINYNETDNFINNINTLLDKGYNTEDINKFYEKLSIKDTLLVINNDYVKDLNKYLDLAYFKSEYLERYINYYKKSNELSYEDIVTYVNIGLDNDYYTNIKDVEKPDDLYVICNKYNKLSKSYVPEDLVKVDSAYSTKSVTLKKEAKEAFIKMADAAKLDNVTLLAGSGYRSYSYQSGLYDAYVKRDGKEEADTYSARAGHSEHQTGLAIDVTDGFKNYLDEDSDGYKWLMKNAHKYGYIVRYTEGDEFITGYQFEPWHVRYLGIEVATDVIESGLTYDEYVARKN